MQSDTAILAYRENIEPVAEMVFQTMLGLRVEPYPMGWDGLPDMVTAAVYFAGAWYGAVLLECTRLQAYEFTHRLMSIETPTVVDDDVRDTLGELANMVAGNLKSVLPGGVVLSMPSVIEGSDYTLQICRKRAVLRVPFWCSSGVFGVTMVVTSGKSERVPAEDCANTIEA